MRTTHAPATTTVLRHKLSAERFVMLANEVARDSRLSFRARGVLVEMISRPPNWRFSAERLAQNSPKEGRDAIQTALRELEAAGYLLRFKERQPDGTFRGVVMVSDQPIAEWVKAPKGDPKDSNREFPQVAPETAQPVSVNPSSIEGQTNEEQNDMTRPPLTSFAAGTQDFNPEWREADRRLFEAIISGDIKTDRSKWKTEDPKATVFTSRAFYDAFRKQADNPVKWPGRWLQSIDENGQMDDWLIDEGLTVIER